MHDHLIETLTVSNVTVRANLWFIFYIYYMVAVGSNARFNQFLARDVFSPHQAIVIYMSRSTQQEDHGRMSTKYLFSITCLGYTRGVVRVG